MPDRFRELFLLEWTGLSLVRGQGGPLGQDGELRRIGHELLLNSLRFLRIVQQDLAKDNDAGLLKLLRVIAEVALDLRRLHLYVFQQHSIFVLLNEKIAAHLLLQGGLVRTAGTVPARATSQARQVRFYLLISHAQALLLRHRRAFPGLGLA